MNRVTVFCAVWHRDPKRRALVAGHLENLRRQTLPVDVVYVFDGGDTPPAGLAALAPVDDRVPRREAVAAYLHEKNGDLELAAGLYADAARQAPNLAERDHQMRQAARLNQALRRDR